MNDVRYDLLPYIVYEQSNAGVEAGISEVPFYHIVAGFPERELAEVYLEYLNTKDSYKHYIIKESEKR